MRKVIIAVIAASTLSSCAGLTQHSIFGSKEGGYVSLNADAAGMQAFSDWNTGVINETRTPEGTKGSYYQLREEQEKQKTFRLKLPKMSGGAK